MPTLLSTSEDLITISVQKQKQAEKLVAAIIFLAVRIYEIDRIVEKKEGIRDVVVWIQSVLDTEVRLDKVESLEGCVALHVTIVSDELNIWDKIEKLQEEVYNPESQLATYNSSHKPCRVQCPVREEDIKEHYWSPQSVYNEEKYLLEAAKAAKLRFFQVAEEEIRARKVADRAFIVAEKANAKLQQAFDMYTDVALDIKKPENIEEAKAELIKARESVNDYVKIVSQAANAATKISRRGGARPTRPAPHRGSVLASRARHPAVRSVRGPPHIHT